VLLIAAVVLAMIAIGFELRRGRYEPSWPVQVGVGVVAAAFIAYLTDDLAFGLMWAGTWLGLGVVRTWWRRRHPHRSFWSTEHPRHRA
jgi:hypothetical protein